MLKPNIQLGIRLNTGHAKLTHGYHSKAGLDLTWPEGFQAKTDYNNWLDYLSELGYSWNEQRMPDRH